MQFFIRVQSSHLKLLNDRDKIATYIVNNDRPLKMMNLLTQIYLRYLREIFKLSYLSFAKKRFENDWIKEKNIDRIEDIVLGFKYILAWIF